MGGGARVRTASSDCIGLDNSAIYGTLSGAPLVVRALTPQVAGRTHAGRMFAVVRAVTACCCLSPLAAAAMDHAPAPPVQVHNQAGALTPTL